MQADRYIGSSTYLQGNGSRSKLPTIFAHRAYFCTHTYTQFISLPYYCTFLTFWLWLLLMLTLVYAKVSKSIT